jgi:SAM-dependent methyltransferase
MPKYQLDPRAMPLLCRAISAVVKNDDAVVDVGAGSGILSFLAVRAGATKVWALETTPVIDEARRLAAANDMDDVVEFLECDAGTFRAADSADVVIGDWIGSFLLSEWRHFEAFVKVRDSCLRPEGSVIPRTARLMLAPISDQRIYMSRGLGFWEEPSSGFDRSSGRTRQLEELRAVRVEAHPDSVIGEPSEIMFLDCLKDDLDAYFFDGLSEIRCPESVTCHGYLGYFEVDLAPDVTMNTSPSAPRTQWQQVYFPTEGFRIQGGDILVSDVRTTRDEATGYPRMILNVELRRGADRPFHATYSYSIGCQNVA